MDIQSDARRLASIATFFVWVGWICHRLRADRRRPVVDRPGAAAGLQPLRGAGPLPGRDRRADLPGAHRRRLRSRHAAVRAVRRQQVRPGPAEASAHDRSAPRLARCLRSSSPRARRVPATGGQLEGTKWVLRSFENGGTLTIVPDGLYADARFTGARVKGFSGCNDYDGIERDGDRTLLISQVDLDEEGVWRRRDDVRVDVSSRPCSTAAATGSLRGSLTIFGAGGEAVLVFDAAPKNPLLGPWNVDSYADAPGSQTVPIVGTELTAVFDITNVGGSSGCNTYAGVYGTNGTVVKIGRLATTRLRLRRRRHDPGDGLPRGPRRCGAVERRGDTLVLRDAGR